MYTDATAPIDTLPDRAPRGTIGKFREVYPGHFGDAVRRLAGAIASARDPHGMNPWGDWHREADQWLRQFTTECEARKAVVA